MADKDKIMKILEAYKGKNFVQRILSPDSYGSIPVPDMGKGKTGTHLMGYASVGSGDKTEYVVFPNIVQDPNSGELIRFSDWHQALNYAMSSGEYIPFQTAEEADWFGKKYKSVWKK